MPASTQSNATVCPYCALLCDDLSVTRQADSSFVVSRNGCTRAAQDFARPPLATAARIGGRNATVEEAIIAAAKLLKRARAPLFGGLACDVDGMRALVNLAEQRGAILDHVHGAALNAMSRVLQSRGWYATTLSEIRNRADLVIVIDVDLANRYENFSRRCLAPRARLRGGQKSPRQTIYLGRRRRASAALDSDLTVNCRPERLTEVLLALLATLRGHALAAARPAGVSRQVLLEIATRMRAASYCALVFAPGTLAGEREPAIAAICDSIDELNTTTRAAMLALGGDDGGQSALSTCAWLTGYPLRTAFGKTIRYEPQVHDSTALLASGAVDALLWVDAFGRHPAPPAGVAAATVILGAAAPPRVQDYGVFIPVGTPGIDHFARLVRTDSVVTLPLHSLRRTTLPSVAEVVTRIHSGT